MNSTHRANVVRIGEILPHPNADKLEITMVGGYQVVIGKGSFKNIREGGVISPVVERRVPGLGRLQLKLVSKSYLEKSN